MDHFLKSFLNLLQYCFCFVLVFRPQGMWAPQLPEGNKLASLALEGKIFNHFNQGVLDHSFLKLSCAVLCLVGQSCPTLCNSMGCSLPGSSVHGDSLGKNTGVGHHALLQGIFPTQRLNPGLPHCRWILNQI